MISGKVTVNMFGIVPENPENEDICSRIHKSGLWHAGHGDQSCETL